MEFAELLKLVAPLASGVVGIFVGIWHAGRTSGKEEAEEKAKAKADLMHQVTTMVNEATEPFGETLRGIRQKINDVELDTEKRFLQKGEFDDFRKEYREDMRDLKALIRNGHQ